MLPLLRQRHIQQLFLRAASYDSQAMRELAEKLADIPVPQRAGDWHIDRALYIAHEFEVRSDFLLKILTGKVRWNPDRGLLTTYVLTIVGNLWKDRARKKDNEAQRLDNDHDIPQANPQSTIDFRLKSFCQMTVESLYLQARIVLKLWKPYLFAYRFGEDEKYYLRQRGINPRDLLRKLEQEIDERIRYGKDCIAPDRIAEILTISRNYVDQIIYRLKKELPWLVEVKQALEIIA